jgi:hypothetical protein
MDIKYKSHRDFWQQSRFLQSASCVYGCDKNVDVVPICVGQMQWHPWKRTPEAPVKHLVLYVLGGTGPSTRQWKDASQTEMLVKCNRPGDAQV